MSDMPGYDGRGASKALELAYRRSTCARSALLDEMCNEQVRREPWHSPEEITAAWRAWFKPHAEAWSGVENIERELGR